MSCFNVHTCSLYIVYGFSSCARFWINLYLCCISLLVIVISVKCYRKVITKILKQMIIFSEQETVLKHWVFRNMNTSWLVPVKWINLVWNHEMQVGLKPFFYPLVYRCFTMIQNHVHNIQVYSLFSAVRSHFLCISRPFSNLAWLVVSNFYHLSSSNPVVSNHPVR